MVLAIKLFSPYINFTMKSVCFLFIVAACFIYTLADYRGCVKKIPRRSIAGTCSSELNCREITDQGVDIGVKCGNHQECVVEKSPKMEMCKDACSDSECNILCQENYGVHESRYCIEARDHPNAYPHGIPAQPNKYYCTCIVPGEFNSL